MRCTISRHMRLVSSTLALSTLVTLLAALARCLERLAGDALDLVLAVLERVVGALALGAVGAGALLVVEALALAEVQAAGELAHDHEVDAGDDLGLKRGGAGERVENLHGAQVGVEAQALADAEQALPRGAGRPGSVVSHFGPPTAASSTASAAFAASSVAWPEAARPPHRWRHRR